MTRKAAVVVLLALLGVAACGDDAAPEKSSQPWTTNEQRIEGVPVARGSLVWFGPEGVRSAHIKSGDGGQTLVLDGKAGHIFEAVKATWGAAGTDVVAHEMGPVLFISPDGRRVAHPAQVEGRVTMVVDGVQGPSFDRVWPPKFSPDSRHVAYVGIDGGKSVVIQDKREVWRGDGVSSTRPDGWPSLYFSPTGGRLGFAEVMTTATGRRERAVIDGAARAVCGQVWDIVFSPDGKHVAHIVTDIEGQPGMLVIHDSRLGPTFKRIRRSLVFSPDSQHLAYLAQTEVKKWSLILKHEAQPQAHDDVRGAPVFSPDGSRVLYVAEDGGRQRVIDGDRVGKAYERIGPLRLVAPGDHLVYSAVDAEGGRTVVDGVEGPHRDHAWPVRFSHDGRRYAYRTMSRDRITAMVIDGKLHPVGDKWASDPVFSPDGRCVAYGVHRDKQAHMVLDGAKGPQYERFVGLGVGSWTDCRFVGNNRLQYVAVRDGSFYLVEAVRR